MRALYIQVGGAPFDIYTALIIKGFEVDTVDYAFNEFDDLGGAMDTVDDLLGSKHFDFVISYQFVIGVGRLCEKYKVKYLCWIYDSPTMSIFSPQAKYDTNYFFIFDLSESERVADLGYPNVFYFPLAGNCERTGSVIISPDDENCYSHDVSFVGNIYKNSARNDIINSFKREDQDYVHEYINKNLCDWRNPRRWPRVSENCSRYMQERASFNETECGCLDPALYIGNLLTRSLAERERVEVLLQLSQEVPVDLYTYGVHENLGNTVIHPSVDYMNTLCKIYFLSKINLNITIPSIETGVPLRVFDIMSCGGFVLTNAQPEIYELFDVGEEIEVYHDIDELIRKTKYYLSHDNERINIALKGYKKVTEKYSLSEKLDEMIALSGVCNC